MELDQSMVLPRYTRLKYPWRPNCSGVLERPEQSPVRPIDQPRAHQRACSLSGQSWQPLYSVRRHAREAVSNMQRMNSNGDQRLMRTLLSLHLCCELPPPSMEDPPYGHAPAQYLLCGQHPVLEQMCWQA